MHQAIDEYCHFKDVFSFASQLALFLLPECPAPGSCPSLPFWGSLLPLGQGFCFPQFNSKYSLRALAQCYDIKKSKKPCMCQKVVKILYLQLFNGNQPNLVIELNSWWSPSLVQVIYNYPLCREQTGTESFLSIDTQIPGTVHFSWSIPPMGWWWGNWA